jgi:hypothetical protein
MADDTPKEEVGFTAEALAGSLAAQQTDAPAADPNAVTTTTPPTETPPAETPPSEPTETADASQIGFRDALKSRGYDVSQFDDDEAIVDHLVEQARVSARVPQLEQAARYVEYLAPYADEIDKLVQAKQQPAAEPTPAEEHYWGTAPEWDPTWEQYLETDASGKVTTAPNSPSPNLHHKYIARRDWERQKASRLVTDPAAAVRPGLQSDFDKINERMDKIEQGLVSKEETQRVNSFVVANENWLYQQDANGQPVIDPASRQPIFSERGAEFVRIAQELQQTGMDADQIPAYAMRMLPPENGQTIPSSPGATTTAPVPAPPTTSTPPVADEMKDQFLAGAFTPPRGGASIAAAAQPHAPFLGPDEDAITLLDKAFKQKGITDTGP